MPPILLEKTRREPKQFPAAVGPPRGVLQAADPRGSAFFHQRLAPPPHLAALVQHFWYVQWDLRGAPPSRVETLPHPSCYLVFEHVLEPPPGHPSVHQKAELSGVTTGKFSRTMQGHGRVFGLKFQPGGLRPFYPHSVSALTDRVVPAAQVFGPAILTLATQLRALDTPEAMAAVTAAHFTRHLPATDPSTALATHLVETCLADPTILTVETLARRTGRSVRALQRLFKEYVGASPKWVIRRFRLHELLERFHSGESFDGAQLALDLGYADQAHLINDFRKLAGLTPTEYARRTASPR
jgi:AraC-like DNA-binding protein